MIMTIVTCIQVMRKDVLIPDGYEYCNIYQSNEARGVESDEHMNIVTYIQVIR